VKYSSGSSSFSLQQQQQQIKFEQQATAAP
jgi:hypothetical protein